MNRKYIPLTVDERKIVEDNISLVKKIVRLYIGVNKDISGLVYDDLLQEGGIGLCTAAKTFNGSVLFETYASKVIRNHLIDHCRKALRSNRQMILTDSERKIDVIDIPAGDNISNVITDIDISRLLADQKRSCSGCVLKGIEALELKISGYSGTEIAALYGVSPNLVGAWISKALKRLRDDEGFVKELRDCG